MTASIPPPSPAPTPQVRPHRGRRSRTPIVVAIVVIGALAVAGVLIMLARSPGPPGAPGTPLAAATTCGDPCTEIRPRVEVTWTAPTDGGEVTGYRVERDGEPLAGAGVDRPREPRPDRRRRGTRSDLHLSRHRVRRGGQFPPVLRGHRRDRASRGRPRPTRRRLRRAPEGPFRPLVGRHAGHRPAGAGQAWHRPVDVRFDVLPAGRGLPHDVGGAGRRAPARWAAMAGVDRGPRRPMRWRYEGPGADRVRSADGRRRRRGRHLEGPIVHAAWSRSGSCARGSGRRPARSR